MPFDILFQELEKSLKATCEEFIMSVTKLVVDPLLSFVTKVCVSVTELFVALPACKYKRFL